MYFYLVNELEREIKKERDSILKFLILKSVQHKIFLKYKVVSQWQNVRKYAR